MPKRKAAKGVVLLVILATVLIVVILSRVILGVVFSHSRLTQHQISRIKAYYAIRGIMNYTLDMLRKGSANGGWDLDPTLAKTACYGDCSAWGNSHPNYTISLDGDLPRSNIMVTIYPKNQADNATINSRATQINIQTDYTYTPD